MATGRVSASIRSNPFVETDGLTDTAVRCEVLTRAPDAQAAAQGRQGTPCAHPARAERLENRFWQSVPGNPCAGTLSRSAAELSGIPP